MQLKSFIRSVSDSQFPTEGAGEDGGAEAAEFGAGAGHGDGGLVFAGQQAVELRHDGALLGKGREWDMQLPKTFYGHSQLCRALSNSGCLLKNILQLQSVP